MTATTWTPLAAGVASRSRVVPLPASGRVGDLLHGCPTNLVFSNAEQRHCHRRPELTGWSGRLAAKLAVCDLLGIDAVAALRTASDIGLAGLEILPEPHGLCGDSSDCFKPHAPQVVMSPYWVTSAAPGFDFQISISHTRQLAIALAVRSGGPLPEGR